MTLAFSVRALTANFLRAHLSEPGWFPSGIYAAFDRQAGKGHGRGTAGDITYPARADARRQNAQCDAGEPARLADHEFERGGLLL